eukprot:6475969-Amphidinium_carterae.1
MYGGDDDGPGIGSSFQFKRANAEHYIQRKADELELRRQHQECTRRRLELIAQKLKSQDLKDAVDWLDSQSSLVRKGDPAAVLTKPEIKELVVKLRNSHQQEAKASCQKTPEPDWKPQEPVCETPDVKRHGKEKRKVTFPESAIDRSGLLEVLQSAGCGASPEAVVEMRDALWKSGVQSISRLAEALAKLVDMSSLLGLPHKRSVALAICFKLR